MSCDESQHFLSPLYCKLYSPFHRIILFLLRWLPEPLALAGVWESTVEPITDTSCIDAAAECELEQEEYSRNFIFFCFSISYLISTPFFYLIY